MFATHHQRFLKVKIKSLAAEAKIIRQEEKKSKDSLREGLYQHRTWDVRREARASQLAYAYLRGRPLRAVEPGAQRCPYLDKRASQIVKKFGSNEAYKGFDAWLKA